MAGSELIFRRVGTGGLPSHLVFGGGDDSDAGGSGVLVDGYLPQLTGAILVSEVLPVYVDGALPTLKGAVTLAEVVEAVLAGDLPPLGGALDGLYDSQTSRPTVGGGVARWEVAEAAFNRQLKVSQFRASPYPAPRRTIWQEAQPVLAEIKNPAAYDLVHAYVPTEALFQAAERAHTAAHTGKYDVAVPEKIVARAVWQEGVRLCGIVTTGWQDRVRAPRPEICTVWEAATRFGIAYTDGIRGATALSVWPEIVYQNAWPPRPGYSEAPPKPVKEPCHVPKLPSHLVFSERPWGGHLLFTCKKHDDPNVPTTIVIPILGAYVIDNTISLILDATGEELPAADFSFSTDRNSWTWSFNSAMHGDALAKVRRETPGIPKIATAWVNGHPLKVQLDDTERDRDYQTSVLRVGGRGLSAMLATNSQVFDMPSDLTAQQIANQILTVNGIPMGWGVDWHMYDWMVPQRAWAPQGTYIDALNQLAEGGGGYIQSHPSQNVLKFLKHYPQQPRDWGAVIPDYDLPSDAVTVEGIRWVDKTEYNRVLVMGQGVGGVSVSATVEGAAGTTLHPMVSHPLITHVDAGRARAEAIFGDTGAIATVTLKTMVFPDVGFILPGSFVRYRDGGTIRMGLARGISVDAAHAESWQTIVLETHE